MNKKGGGKTIKYFQNLRKIREDRDLLQKDIARILNIYQQQYQRYETGERQMPINYYKTLAKYYNVSIDFLSGLTDIPRTLTGEPYFLSSTLYIDRKGNINKK